MQLIINIVALFLKDPYWTTDYAEELFSDKSIPILFTGISCTAIASIWFFIKPSIIKAGEVDVARKQISSWKNNVQLFQTLLHQQKHIDTTIWDDDFVLGNREALIVMIVAMNPYCRTCGKEYEVLANLIKIHGNNLFIIIRFGADLSKPNLKNQAVQYLIHDYRQTPKELQVHVLSNWYTSSDLNHLKAKYPDIDLKDQSLLEKYEHWFKEVKIHYTPTLFLNGYQFPQPYNIADFKTLILGFLDLKKTIAKPEKALNV